MRFSCHCFRKKRFTGSRRAYKQGTFRELRSDRCVFTRVVQEIHDFLKGFLRFILSCHILKGNSCVFLNISFRTALAYTHHSAAPVHAAHKYHQKHKQYNGRQKHADQHGDDLSHCIRLLILEGNSRSFQSFCQFIH